MHDIKVIKSVPLVSNLSSALVAFSERKKQEDITSLRKIHLLRNTKDALNLIVPTK